jgi:hypothetical protein
MVYGTTIKTFAQYTKRISMAKITRRSFNKQTMLSQPEIQFYDFTAAD